MAGAAYRTEEQVTLPRRAVAPNGPASRKLGSSCGPRASHCRSADHGRGGNEKRPEPSGRGAGGGNIRSHHFGSEGGCVRRFRQAALEFRNMRAFRGSFTSTWRAIPNLSTTVSNLSTQ